MSDAFPLLSNHGIIPDTTRDLVQPAICQWESVYFYNPDGDLASAWSRWPQTQEDMGKLL